MAMSDLVKRLRDHAHWGMTEEAADRIEELERELAERSSVLFASVPTEFKGCTSPVGAVQAYIVTLEEAIVGATGNELDDVLEPHLAAYRKARGL